MDRSPRAAQSPKEAVLGHRVRIRTRAVTAMAFTQGPARPSPMPGVYQWVATYSSSNENNNLSVGPIGCGETAEQVTVQTEAFEVIGEQRF